MLFNFSIVTSGSIEVTEESTVADAQRILSSLAISVTNETSYIHIGTGKAEVSGSVASLVLAPTKSL